MRISKDFLCLRNHLLLWGDGPGAVDDPVVLRIAFDQVVGRAGENLWHHIAVVSRAGLGTEKDRPGFRIGLWRGKRAMRKDQHLGAFGNEPQAVTTGVAAPV